MFEVPHQGGDRRGILLCDSSVKQGQKKKSKHTHGGEEDSSQGVCTCEGR